MALPAASVTGLPLSAAPSLEQVPVAIGPQTKKLTVPVGVPPAVLPETVAESVIESPSVIELCCGVVTVVDGALPTVKHSVMLESEEPLYLRVLELKTPRKQ